MHKLSDFNDRINPGNNAQNFERLSQTGKAPEEMLLYHLSGEPDDLSIDFFNEV